MLLFRFQCFLSSLDNQLKPLVVQFCVNLKATYFKYLHSFWAKSSALSNMDACKRTRAKVSAGLQKVDFIEVSINHFKRMLPFNIPWKYKKAGALVQQK